VEGRTEAVWVKGADALRQSRLRSYVEGPSAWLATSEVEMRLWERTRWRMKVAAVDSGMYEIAGAAAKCEATVDLADDFVIRTPSPVSRDCANRMGCGLQFPAKRHDGFSRHSFRCEVEKSGTNK
jgi:hypothetical protein